MFHFRRALIGPVMARVKKFGLTEAPPSAPDLRHLQSDTALCALRNGATAITGMTSVWRP